MDSASVLEIFNSLYDIQGDAVVAKLLGCEERELDLIVNIGYSYEDLIYAIRQDGKPINLKTLYEELGNRARADLELAVTQKRIELTKQHISKKNLTEFDRLDPKTDFIICFDDKTPLNSYMTLCNYSLYSKYLKKKLSQIEYNIGIDTVSKVR